jgi:hypothetical protein
MVHYTLAIKENYQHHFGFASHLACFFSCGKEGDFHCDDYCLVIRVVSVDPYFITLPGDDIFTSFCMSNQVRCYGHDFLSAPESTVVE